jgi:hypothetical protein
MEFVFDSKKRPRVRFNCYLTTPGMTEEAKPDKWWLCNSFCFPSMVSANTEFSTFPTVAIVLCLILSVYKEGVTRSICNSMGLDAEAVQRQSGVEAV